MIYPIVRRFPPLFAFVEKRVGPFKNRIDIVAFPDEARPDRNGGRQIAAFQGKIRTGDQVAKTFAEIGKDFRTADHLAGDFGRGS
ncbi:MAG: hypothetical protein NTW38_00085, partial [Candidatus Aminicenantes bacterium]|nr:hypothetical protein [Candidatus Aminicenantes bacterium]